MRTEISTHLFSHRHTATCFHCCHTSHHSRLHQLPRQHNSHWFDHQADHLWSFCMKLEKQYIWFTKMDQQLLVFLYIHGVQTHKRCHPTRQKCFLPLHQSVQSNQFFHWKEICLPNVTRKQKLLFFSLRNNKWMIHLRIALMRSFSFASSTVTRFDPAATHAVWAPSPVARSVTCL